MNYQDDMPAISAEIKRIHDYLRARGVHATPMMIIGAAITVTKRLGAGDYTFYSELK
jgi:hypothetical protein